MAVPEKQQPAIAPPPAEEAAVLTKLSTLDRFLPLWIGLAMAAGLGLGRLIPSLNDGLDKLQVGTVSLPIALGLLLMMYPVLAKVRYEELGRMRHDGVSDRLFFGSSLFLSWIVGPLLMFALAWLLLPNQPAYRTGVIIVGLARCIAMVLIWNDIAQGDRDRTALLVVFNALFQVAAYSLLGYFYLTVLPGWLGLDTQGFEVGIWEVARTVLIFLGIPLAAGFLTRRIGIKRKGREWYDTKLHPADQPDHALRAAVHDRGAVRDPGRQDHLAAARRRPDRRCRCSSTSPSCGSPASRSGRLIGLPYAADREHGLHRRLQRLRARDRGRRRRLRRDLRPGTRRRRRAADRSAGARRARLRRALGAPLLAQRSHDDNTRSSLIRTTPLLPADDQ